MNAAMAAAGWRTIGDTDPSRPDPCDGSGQLAMFAEGIVTCPVCGRTVAAVLTGPLGSTTGPWVVAHNAPAAEPSTRSTRDDGPTLGL